ncbi:PAS domain-containing sensor histidine kinase [Pedobacter sp. P351]|uniref:PAS domain-containing sensor histidine kinase n=1 Tax=Pedobacter superstes TaxID=3133441 RepID=UPI0030984735
MATQNVEFVLSQVEKQALLAAIVNSSDDAIISKTLKGIITSWNRAAEVMFGYTGEEVIGKHISILIPPSRIKEEGIIIGNVVKGRRVDHFETIRLAKDGREIPVSLTVSPIVDSDGTVIGASKIARDIRDKKAADEKQAILAAIVDSSDDAIISKTLKGIITSWNKAAEVMFGYTGEEIIGKHITVLIPPSRIKEEEIIIGNVVKGNRVDHFETIRLAKDGREIQISLTVSPIIDSQGVVIGASKIARDISDKKIADEKQAILAAIVDSSSDAIVSKTLNGIITSWNRSATRLFGYTQDEIIGKHISLLIPPSRFHEEDIIIGNISLGKKIDHFDTIRISKDGREIPVSLSVSPVLDKNGNIIGASKIARDISEKIKDLEIREQLFTEIKELNQKKDVFIGLASHELKTPLTSINGYLQIIGRLNEGAKSQQFIDKTLQQVSKLSNLVSDMLDVSKIEANQLRFSNENFDILKVVDNAIEIFDHTNNSHEIILHSTCDNLTVVGDPNRMEQAIVNLLTNAIKYSSNSTKVDVFLSCTENEIKIGVKDYGCGIAPDKLEKIFSRFYRIEDVNPHISGLGIGLYITKQIIDRHNGKVWAESKEGEGSTFWFTLPLVVPE